MARKRLKAVLVSILIFVPVYVAILVTKSLGGSDQALVLAASITGLVTVSALFILIGGNE